MDEYKSILVVADVNNTEQSALSRAFQIVRDFPTPTPITFFLSIYDFSYDMTSMLSSDERDAMRRGVIQQREEWMKEVSAPYLQAGIQFTIKVIWHHRPFEAIIGEIFAGEHDLLLKATRKHDTLETVFFTPTDWHLLRKCPCPVLLVKNHDWPLNGSIVASVHVGSESETHVSLNHYMTEQAIKFSKPLNAEVYLANSYPVTPANVTVELPEFDPTSYTDAVRGFHLTSMKALRQKYTIDEDHTRVLEGLPEDVIPKVATEVRAGLVIIGTTGRTGLSAVFIGNTAENVIDKINCDILALKPHGYISPLDPNN